MNGTNNKDNLKVFDLDFDDLYQFQHIQLALADLISKDDPNRPIIAAHPIGCNNISELPESIISQEDKEKINQVLKQDGSAELLKNEAKKQLKELSESAVKEEFNAIFALVDARKRPVLYIRWMPKDDELFAATRPNHKGHFVCLYFFHDHNNEKSILIANPNGMGITEASEANIISSYLEKNPTVNIYQSQDYTQFNNTTCGPGALVLLRMLYNINYEDLEDILKENQTNTIDTKIFQYYDDNLQKYVDDENANEKAFSYIPIKFKTNALQKEIGKIPQKNTQEEKDVDQKVRYADYATAKVCKEHNDAIKNNDFVAIALANIDFDQELVKDLPQDQSPLLSKFLLSGKQLLTPEQIQQAQQKRREILGVKGKKTVKIKLSGGREKDPKELLSNEGKRSHQHTRENVKRKSISDSDNEYKKIPTKKSEFSKILATTAAFIGVALLCSAIFIDVKKEFKIGGIVLSSIMLISAVTCFLWPGKTPDSKMTIATEDTPCFNTVIVHQQLSQK